MFNRFGKFLLQIHDNELKENKKYVDDRPNIFVMFRSNHDFEPFQLIDFTEYIIRTVHCTVFYYNTLHGNQATIDVCHYCYCHTAATICAVGCLSPKHPRDAFFRLFLQPVRDTRVPGLGIAGTGRASELPNQGEGC